MGNAPICAVRMNLIALEFGAFKSGRIDNNSSGRIHFASHEKSLLPAVTKNFDQHFDHVIIGVVIIVKQDDVEAGNVYDPRFALGENFLGWDNDFHCDESG